MAEQKPNVQPTPDRGPLLLSIIVGLSVICTVVMLFSGSTGAMKIAVILALWAAILGLILVASYRRRFEFERERLRSEKARFVAELEKEQIAHREQELLLEQRYLDNLRASQDETLAAIRAQLDAVRGQIEALTGTVMSFETPAISAMWAPPQELEATQNAAQAEDSQEPVEAEPVTGEFEATGTKSDSDRGDSHFDTSSFAEVSWVAPKQEQESEPQPEPKPEPKPEAQPAPKPQPQPQPKPEVKPDPKPQPKPEVKADAQSAPHAQKDKARGGRRRRDEHQGGLSVAELLKRSQGNS